MEWYNNEHLHSALNFVTPEQKHTGEDIEILIHRKELYEEAKRKNPNRWIKGETRNWTPVTHTSLNPINEREIEKLHKKVA